jgi:hypothetical protein
VWWGWNRDCPKEDNQFGSDTKIDAANEKQRLDFNKLPLLVTQNSLQTKETNPTSHWGKRSLTSGNNAAILFILLCLFSDYNRVINNQKPYLITPMIKLSSGRNRKTIILV